MLCKGSRPNLILTIFNSRELIALLSKFAHIVSLIERFEEYVRYLNNREGRKQLSSHLQNRMSKLIQ